MKLSCFLQKDKTKLIKKSKIAHVFGSSVVNENKTNCKQCIYSYFVFS